MGKEQPNGTFKRQGDTSKGHAQLGFMQTKIYGPIMFAEVQFVETIT
jgi:hypothetical protein